MIPVSTTIAPPLTAPTQQGADRGAHDVSLHDHAAPEMSGPEKPGGAPSNLPASHDLHAQVQNAGYAAPHGGAGAQGTSQAPVNPRKAAQAHMSHGIAALKAHDYKQAIESFREAYKLYPSPKILMNLGSALRDAGQFAEAVVVYEQYLSDPSRDTARDGEVRTAMESARAKLGGQTYSADDVAQSKELMTRGLEAVRAGRYDEALEAFRSAHAHNPLPEFLHNQAFCLEKLSAPMSAARLYREFAEATPNKGEASQARASAARLSAHGANAPITAAGLAGGMEWMQRGNQLLAAHKYEQALAAFQEGFRTYPDSKFILNEAAALSDSGRYAEADLAYQRYLSNPAAPRADEAREAQQRLRTEHLGGREATITGVAESKRLMEEFGTLYKAGKYGEAFDALERARTLNPLAIQRHDQAVCLAMMGKPELAAQFYEKYLSEKPGAPDTDSVKRKISNLHGQALQLAQQAFDRGAVAFREGRTQDAASAFLEAWSHKPFPQFLFNAAASYEKGGDTARAVQHYQRYLDAAPDAPDAAKVRGRIEVLLIEAGSALMKPSDGLRPAVNLAFERGQLMYEHGRYKQAQQAFAEAYRHSPMPQFLYNQGAALHKGGDLIGAVRFYQQYLDAAPNAPDADKVRRTIHLLLDKAGAGLMKPQ
jgi:tetratricopeptide (TPR) repeat protein